MPDRHTDAWSGKDPTRGREGACCVDTMLAPPKREQAATIDGRGHRRQASYVARLRLRTVQELAGHITNTLHWICVCDDASYIRFEPLSNCRIEIYCFAPYKHSRQRRRGGCRHERR